MEGREACYVLKEKAVPEVLLKVEKAKTLLESGKCKSASEAADRAGISRSSFYKYKDDIRRYHEDSKGRQITMVIKLDDEPGLLSLIVKTVAEEGANILTIHQAVPVSGVAAVTISMSLPESVSDPTDMQQKIESIEGIQYAKIFAQEQ